MTGTRYQLHIQDSDGTVIEGAELEVRDQDSNSLVTIWDNRATTTTKTNPTTSNANGYAYFYRTGGRYKITVTSGAFSQTFQDVPLGNSQEYDVGTSAGTLVLYENFASVAFDGLYSSLTGTPTLGTMAALDSGTGGSNFRTNTQNDARFLQVANNLNDVTASSARANLDLSNIYSLEGVVTNGAVPLKSAGAFIDSPLTFDGNDAAAFSSGVSIAGALAVGADSAVTGELQVGDGTGSESISIYCLNTGFARVRFSKGTAGTDLAHGAIVYNFANDSLAFFNAGAVTALSIDSNQNVSIPAGNLDVTGSGAFTTGVTPATSQDALTNLVEDTYNATLTCGTSGTVTLNSNFDTLRYTRINGRCYVSGFIEVSSISSPLGGLTLNLPFASAALPELSERSGQIVVASGLATKNCNELGVRVEGGSSNATFYLVDGASLGATVAPEMQANTVLVFDFSYPV